MGFFSKPGASSLLTSSQIEQAFPFHFTLDPGLRFVQLGTSLRKILPELRQGIPFSDAFTVQLAFEEKLAAPDLHSLGRTGKPVVLACDKPAIRLRGQFVERADDKGLLFLGTLFVEGPAQLVTLGLDRSDFAAHELSIEPCPSNKTEHRLAAAGGDQGSKSGLPEIGARVLALLAEYTDNAVILTDASRKIVWTNQGFTRITGYSQQEVLGRRPGELLQGRGTDPATIRKITTQLADEAPFREVVLNYRKDGRPYWIELEVHPIHDDAGRLTHFMALQRDITEARSLNRRLLLRHEVTRQLVESEGLETALIEASRSIAAVLGWTHAALYRRQGKVLELIQGDPAAPMRIDPFQGIAGRAWRERIVNWGHESGGSAMILCLPLVHADEAWGMMRFQIDDEQAPTNDIIDILDFLGHEFSLVIGRAVSHEELVAARDAAEEASAVKSQFVATVSHEIRTPLNAVVGMADLLADMPLGDRQREYLKVIQDSADQLLSVVNDVLDLSSIESGSVRLGEADFSVRQQAQRIVQIVRGLPGAARLEIREEIDVAVPDWVLGDEARLSQALINLMSNAVKFTEAGSVILHVNAEPKADDDARIWLSFSVQDTGVGIPRSVQDKIFEPYFQVGSSLLTPQKGTGLGLAICRQIALLMGGEMTLQSEIGEGACFTLSIPLKLGQNLHTASTETTAPQQVMRSLEILVAEDTPASQLVIRLMLENMGHRVTIAGDGLEAVRAFRTHRFDLVLMDVQMPHMDGYEAARAIRALRPEECPPGVRDARQVPIVGLSAFAMSSNRVAGIESGMNAYLTKPVQRESLRELIAGIGSAENPAS